jgi:hypothetical protein
MFAIVQGDLVPDLTLTCMVNGQAEDISDATALVMQWVKPDHSTSEVALVAVDLSAGRVKYSFASGDTDQAGTHQARVKVTHASGKVQHFPSDGTYFSWLVSK